MSDARAPARAAAAGRHPVTVATVSGILRGQTPTLKALGAACPPAAREVIIPASVTEAIASRLNVLPPPGQRLLGIAAVIGVDISPILLEGVASARDATVQRAITLLHRADVLREVTLRDETIYSFKHALVHDVAYARLSSEERRTIHADVLHAMQRIYRDRPGDHVERLAHHAVEAEQWAEAVDYLIHAGRKSLERAAYSEAIDHFTRARAAVERLSPIPRRHQQELDIHVFLGSVHLATRWTSGPRRR